MILHDYLEIIKGNHILKRIAHKRRQTRDFAIFVFPDNDKELNECAIRYLEAYCDYNGTKELFVVSTEGVYIPDAPVSLKSKCDIRKMLINSRQMDSVLHFGATYSAPYLCFISLDKPYGRYDDRMIGHSGIMLDDIICSFLYDLRTVPGRTEAIE